MCKEDLCQHDGAKSSVYKKNSKLFGFVENNKQLPKLDVEDGEIYRQPYEKDKSTCSLYLLKCGHTQLIRRQHFRAGKFRCSPCLDESRQVDASFSGFIYKGTTQEDSDISLYECSKGHLVKLSSHNIKVYHKNGEKYPCSECLVTVRYEAAARNNLELLDHNDTSKWMYREYRFKKCGHFQKIRLSEVEKDMIPACVECRWESNEQVAKEQGIVLLRTGENNKSVDVILPCGCNQKLRMGNITRGVWACKNHSNYYNKVSYLYVIKLEFKDISFIKVGISSKPDRRFKEYGILKDCKLTPLFLQEFRTVNESLLVEKAVHRTFKTSKDYRNMVENYVPSGYTECYPISMKDILLEELRRLDGT